MSRVRRRQDNANGEFELTPGFIQKHPEHLAEGNAMEFLSDDGGETYNKCHCESLTVLFDTCSRQSGPTLS